MATCPKCNHKLKITDISQFCPECGVNMRFVNFEDNFIREAKIAELSQATVQVKIKRLKAALIGTKLNIVRLCVALLPVLALLLPAGAFGMKLPFSGAFDVTLGALGIYGMFTSGGLDLLGIMCASDHFGKMFSTVRLALFSYIGAAVFVVAVLLATILCFCSIKNMQKIISGISIGGIAVCIVNAVLTSIAVKTMNNGAFSASYGAGIFVLMAAFAVVVVINLILEKKGIPVEYAEGSLERLAIWKKVKAGEVAIDDLPQPVVETEETRKIEEEIAKEEAKFNEAKTKKEGEED